MMKNSTNSFPFSVGFPLSIRESENTLSICGANRGDGWPILCEVPKGPHARKDAESIIFACTKYMDEFISIKQFLDKCK
jgi:hypothetical protein